MVKADFGFRAGFNRDGRLFNPALGGGGLLDVGVYTVSLASMVFGGPPTRIASMADLGETGVDEQAGLVLGYGPGRMAVLTCAVRTNTPHEAHIMGTDGMIHIHHPFWHGTTLTLSRSGQQDAERSCPYVGNGYNCEAAEVIRCVRAGRLESDIMPLDETITVMETMDRIRAQWGLKYPME
jgi:predicted dehydrogenase